MAGFIKSRTAAKTADLVRQLNSKIRGWANYHRHVVAKKTFACVDHQVSWALRGWIYRRHPNKSAQWKRKRYFRRCDGRNWVFFALTRDPQGESVPLELFQAARVPITRHVKIRADATPYDPAFTDYFAQRARSRRISPLTWDGMVADA